MKSICKILVQPLWKKKVMRTLGTLRLILNSVVVSKTLCALDKGWCMLSHIKWTCHIIWMVIELVSLCCLVLLNQLVTIRWNQDNTKCIRITLTDTVSNAKEGVTAFAIRVWFPAAQMTRYRLFFLFLFLLFIYYFFNVTSTIRPTSVLGLWYD